MLYSSPAAHAISFPGLSRTPIILCSSVGSVGGDGGFGVVGGGVGGAGLIQYAPEQRKQTIYSG